MAEELRAVPEILSDAGNQLAGHGDSLLAWQQTCHGRMEDAQPGWIGSSANALSSLLDGWAAASTAHLSRFTQHSAGMHLAAGGFAELEQRNAGTLRSR